MVGPRRVGTGTLMKRSTERWNWTSCQSLLQQLLPLLFPQGLQVIRPLQGGLSEERALFRHVCQSFLITVLSYHSRPDRQTARPTSCCFRRLLTVSSFFKMADFTLVTHRREDVNKTLLGRGFGFAHFTSQQWELKHVKLVKNAFCKYAQEWRGCWKVFNLFLAPIWRGFPSLRAVNTDVFLMIYLFK